MVSSWRKMSSGLYDTRIHAVDERAWPYGIAFIGWGEEVVGAKNKRRGRSSLD